jgi:hypothetical protein
MPHGVPLDPQDLPTDFTNFGHRRSDREVVSYTGFVADGEHMVFHNYSRPELYVRTGPVVDFESDELTSSGKWFRIDISSDPSRPLGLSPIEQAKRTLSDAIFFGRP